MFGFFVLLVLSEQFLQSSARGNNKEKVPLSKSMNVLETLEKANAGLEEFLTQADIVTSRQKAAAISGLAPPAGVMSNADPCTISSSTSCLWPKVDSKVRVPYKISKDIRGPEKNFIIAVMKSFEASTCVYFEQASRSDQDYVNIISGTGCWSFVGKIGGEQLLSLQKNGCLYTNTIQHEFLHVLGFHHEHSRHDRDENVTIHLQNVQSGYESNFNKIATNNLGTPYDFHSVMQYHNYAFSSNGQMTISANHNPNFLFGDAVEMSENDIRRVNLLYGC